MEIDRAILTAASAILGSLVGGSATIATAWLTQRTQGRRESVEAEVRKREALYADFIAEGSKLVVDSLDHELDRPESFRPLCRPQPDPARLFRRRVGGCRPHGHPDRREVFQTETLAGGAAPALAHSS